MKTISEKIPRRSSCQFQGINRKKIKIFEAWLNRKNKKNFKLKKFKINIFFFLHDMKFNNFHIHFPVLFPFGFRISLNKICIVTLRKWEMEKKKIFKKLITNNIGKIISKANFKAKLMQFPYQKKISKNFFFLFEENMKKVNSEKLLNFLFHFNHLLMNLKIKKNILLGIIKALSSFWLKLPFRPFLSIKFEKNNCPKKIINNLFQILGNIFDIVPGGFVNIKKLFIQSGDSLSLELFFQN